MLLATVAGAYVTQKFGPSHLRVEPAMYSTGDKAYWLPYFGASFFEDFHPGIDRAASYGTAVTAMEAGTVVFAAWKDSISGKQVEIQINDAVRFSVNHLSVIAVKVGQKVAKGQKIGEIGTTGATTGPHVHEGVSIREKDQNGIYRTFLYNGSLFLPGGSRSGDPIIKPEERYFALNGPGINIRKVPIDFDDGAANIFATSREATAQRRAGIYQRSTNKRIGPIDRPFRYLRERETEEGRFIIGSAFSRTLAVRKSLTHWVDN